jgi:hypothetical protein
MTFQGRCKNSQGCAKRSQGRYALPHISPQTSVMVDTDRKELISILSFNRKHIYRERGVPDIESLLFEDHEMIKRAAAECMCNLVYCQEVSVKATRGINNRHRMRAPVSLQSKLCRHKMAH